LLPSEAKPHTSIFYPILCLLRFPRSQTNVTSTKDINKVKPWCRTTAVKTQWRIKPLIRHHSVTELRVEKNSGGIRELRCFACTKDRSGINTCLILPARFNGNGKNAVLTWFSRIRWWSGDCKISRENNRTCSPFLITGYSLHHSVATRTEVLAVSNFFLAQGAAIRYWAWLYKPNRPAVANLPSRTFRSTRRLFHRRQIQPCQTAAAPRKRVCKKWHATNVDNHVAHNLERKSSCY
jgi:hypothetical protein